MIVKSCFFYACERTVMSDNLKYSIEKMRYRNRCFKISGYCYANDFSPVSFEAKVNDEPQEVKTRRIYRSDIKKGPKDQYLGFECVIECLNDAQTFELMAQNETILLLNKDDILKIEDTHSIDYDVESIVYDKNIGIATSYGWALSEMEEEIQISILDENKDVQDVCCNKELRTDLMSKKEVDENHGFCGFRLYFKFDEGKQYFIQLQTQSDCVVSKLEPQKVDNTNRLIAYMRLMNKKNFRKLIQYLKRNGLKKLVTRLKSSAPMDRPEYQTWFYTQRVTEQELEVQRNTQFGYTPKISVLVATFNTKEEYLKEMMDTVIFQSYSNWELCIADGSSTNRIEKYVNANYSGYGDKIKYKKLDQNYGISGNTNKAFEMATGDYVTVYDHDDMLELDCFYEIVKVLQDYRYDVLYTDEDRYDDARKEYAVPNFKPDYSEDLLRSHNYITHLFIVSRRIIEQVGYYNSEYDGSQDYDYIFRCVEKANGIYHIARVLYHWRMHPESTAQDPESKMYCYDAGKRAIEAHYKRVKVDASVEMLPKPMYGMYHTIYSIKDAPLVSILIPNYNHKNILKTCIDSLYKVNTYKNFEIVIVENNSTQQEVFDYYEELQKEHDNIQVVTYKGEFNFSKINNFGMKYTKGDYVLLLNNDTEIIEPTALSEMVGCILRDEVGAVGARLLYADDTIQHAGIVLGFIGYAGHVNYGLSKDEHGYMNTECINTNYSAVTAACMMVKKAVFNRVGGFDEQFVVACNDVDLCLKICQEKYLVVYNAFSLWHHYESKSRGYDDESQEKMWRFNQEVHKFQGKWKAVLEAGDPYYNKNWNLLAGAYSLY